MSAKNKLTNKKRPIRSKRVRYYLIRLKDYFYEDKLKESKFY